MNKDIQVGDLVRNVKYFGRGVPYAIQCVERLDGRHAWVRRFNTNGMLAKVLLENLELVE
ncbi:hypothetical protein D1823_02370 [Ruegeria sp. AD91A]|uniref:hypothetical protein n=1 Tax=Ruegeria sp. AD91A TaxID=2293862 RepID=UPI000E4BFCC9|nr:hypothetical protein [Ruegeria sp. AD91A]AXT25542.1 hypothetical protein D1823_02370 [Ruegeria sp. AD91A]